MSLESLQSTKNTKTCSRHLTKCCTSWLTSSHFFAPFPSWLFGNFNSPLNLMIWTILWVRAMTDNCNFYLITVPLLFMLDSYRIEHQDQIRRAISKIRCACNWWFMNIHGIWIFKDGKTDKDKIVEAFYKDNTWNNPHNVSPNVFINIYHKFKLFK